MKTIDARIAGKLARALAEIMAWEGGEPPAYVPQRMAWLKAEKALKEYRKAKSAPIGRKRTAHKTVWMATTDVAGYSWRAFGHTKRQALELIKEEYLMEMSRENHNAEEWETWERFQEYFCVSVSEYTIGEGVEWA